MIYLTKPNSNSNYFWLTYFSVAKATLELQMSVCLSWSLRYLWDISSMISDHWSLRSLRSLNFQVCDQWELWSPLAIIQYKLSSHQHAAVTSLCSHQFQIFLYFLVSKFIISIKLLYKFINPLNLKKITFI